MTNLGEPLGEQIVPKTGIQVVETEEDLKRNQEEDYQMEHISTAEKEAGALGLMHFVLTRYKTDDRDDEEVYVLDKNANLSVQKMREARANNWNIIVQTRNSDIPIGNNQVISNLWLINSGLIMSSTITADHVEQDERGSELSFASWKTSKDSKARDIMVPNDPDILKRIRVNFEVIQPKLGGDTN
ncbi:MAG: hypothetical protein HY427_00645 [Candidatus Levybacteria bacterium]|nr:hypothetical protein [Candidatus Levybacteria bacterium]